MSVRRRRIAKRCGRSSAESERTARLIEDLLLLARADAGLPALPLERLELTPLVRDVCEQGQILAQARQLEISTEVPDEPVYVEANDPGAAPAAPTLSR